LRKLNLARLGVSIVGLLWFAEHSRAEDFRPLRKSSAELEITVDGRLSEPIWAELEPLTEFRVISPGSLADPVHKTDLKMLYSDRGLYLGVYAHQPVDTLVRRLTSRDLLLNRDGVSLSLDSSGKGLYGNWFSVNLGGSLSDGTLLPERTYSNEWNGNWQGAESVTDFGWSAEYFLPWSTVAMPRVDGEQREMGFYLSRKVAYLDERWSLPPLPLTQPLFMSALKKMVLTGVKGSRQLSLRPFVSTSHNNTKNNGRTKAGIDIFFRPQPNLQLGASLLPDFGVVRSDEVFVDLRALEVFLSERRDFFLEGQEIFNTSPRGSNVNGRFLLVNTRRIGQPASVAATLPAGFTEEPSEILRPINLYGAAKLTGQLGRVRYGLLSAFEQDSNIAQTNSTTGQVVHRRVDGQSFGALRFLYEPKRATGYGALGFIYTLVDGGVRNAHVRGIDLHTRSPGSTWQFDSQFMHSKVGGRHGLGTTFDLTYTPVQGKKHLLTGQWFDEDFEVNDLGFAQRNDLLGVRYRFDRTRVNLQRFKQIETWWQTVQDWNNDSQRVRSGWFFGGTIKFNNLNTFAWENHFFPERWEDIESLGNGVFRIRNRGQLVASWETDTSKRLVAKLKYSLLAESLGDQSHRVDLDLTTSPSDRFSAELNLAYRKRNNWLVYTGGRSFTTYDAEYWQPTIDLNFFFRAQNQLSTRMQWIGIKAPETAHYQVPMRPGRLVRMPRAGNPNRSFSVSVLTWQVRYRWQFSPLSELVVIYNRTANLVGSQNRSFRQLFSDGFNETLTNSLVVRLTYNFDV